MTLSTRAPRRFGPAGYLAAALTLVGVLLVIQARSERFIHGSELAWAYAYAIPLLLGCVALALGVLHLLRGRVRSFAAWLPIAGSVALVAWLIAYIYFGAFRSA